MLIYAPEFIRSCNPWPAVAPVVAACKAKETGVLTPTAGTLVRLITPPPAVVIAKVLAADVVIVVGVIRMVAGSEMLKRVSVVELAKPAATRAAVDDDVTA